MEQRSGDESRPLAGVTVLDLSRFVAGPYATMMLADAGADVIKIEPIGGEITRYLEPLLSGPDGETISGYFLRLNRSKRSVTLDLTKDAGKAIFLELVAVADVVVENFRPGVMDRLGIGYAAQSAANPKIIYCSISGYGHTPGPRRDRAAFAAIAEADTGVLGKPERPGDPPVRLGPPIGDIFPGSVAVSGIAMALFRMARTGVGARVDIAMYDAMLSLNECAVALQAMTGRDVNRDQGISHAAPFGLFPTAAGYVCIAVLGEVVWERFAHAIGRPDLLSDDRLTSGARRAEQMDGVLGQALSAWLAERSAFDVAEQFSSIGVPACVVQDVAELLADPQAAARSMLIDAPSYAGVTARLVASPISVGATGPSITPAAAAGEHTAEVLRERLGYSSEKIDQLAASGLISRWPATPAQGAL